MFFKVSYAKHFGLTSCWTCHTSSEITFDFALSFQFGATHWHIFVPCLFLPCANLILCIFHSGNRVATVDKHKHKCIRNNQLVVLLFSYGCSVQHYGKSLYLTVCIWRQGLQSCSSSAYKQSLCSPVPSISNTDHIFCLMTYWSNNITSIIRTVPLKHATGKAITYRMVLVQFWIKFCDQMMTFVQICYFRWEPMDYREKETDGQV